MEPVRHPYQQNLPTAICYSAKTLDSANIPKVRKSPFQTTELSNGRKRRRNPPETKAKAPKPKYACDYAYGYDTRYRQNNSDYKKLLANDELRVLVKNLGLSHTDVKTACENICGYIRNTNPKIKSAWSSYNTNDETNIVFVLIYDSVEDLKEDCDIKYDYIKRLTRQKSPEEKLISEYMESNDVELSDEESKTIDHCMDKHAVNLMKRHKFLSIISKSAIRSRENGNQIHQDPCMILFVHTKNCIPIDEEPFEKEYDGVPVDVREGTFTLYGNAADENQEDLKIGCQIGCRNGIGTLGGFIEHSRFGLCGITAAHVIFDEADFKDVLAKGSGKQDMYEFGIQREVFQPADNKDNIGKAVAVVYKEGAQDETGIDAAIFTIEKRRPLSGQPAGTQTQEDWFESGQIFETSWINTGKDAIKFGYKTSKTQAKFARHLNRIDVKVVDGTMKEFNVTMHNQIAVKSANFAAIGDSGSLFFTRLFDGKLACVGLLVGGNPDDGLVVITPITPILREFGVTSLKNLMIDRNENKLCVLEKKVDRGFDSVNEKLDKLLETRNKERKTS